MRAAVRRSFRVLLLAALLPLAAATTAAASVSIGTDEITVTAPRGESVQVQRDPFALSFRDRDGRTLLHEAPPGAPLAVLPPAPEQQFGTQSAAAPTLYGPLSFIVGSQQISQVPAGNWVANLNSVTTTGVAYRAVAVQSAVADGGGVSLVLSTSDPTGRTLDVRITPAGDNLRVSARPVPDSGVAAMADSFTVAPGEAFRGFGGRHDTLDQHGNEFFNWLQQENVSSGSGSALTAASNGPSYLFPDGPAAAYYVQSSFASSAGYGFLLDDSALSHWRMGSDGNGLWQAEVGQPAIDYTVAAPGSAAGAVEALNQVEGRQRVPPRWALGTLFDREVKYPSDPPAQYLGEVESDLAAFRRFHVHVDGYRIEGWAELAPADLRHLIGQMRARHIHPLVYFRPFVGTDTTGTDDPSLYQYAIDHGYVATHADGSPYTFVSNFNASAALIDFTNPAAVRWWQGRIAAALALGADGFMQDFGEQVMADMHFQDGETGATMHNRYPLLYDAATRQVVDRFMRAHPRRQIFFFTRAGYSGTPGDTATENANFPGDETTDWTRSAGLASLAPDMLNRAVGGAFGFTADIGGYWDLGPYSATTKELFIRWAEWAALSPLFRLHGSLSSGVHTPWSYDAQTVAIYRAMASLHARLAGLILREWRVADRTGMPVTRPLWLAAPGDPVAAAQDQEWLLGPDVLAAPVVAPGVTVQHAYLPAGCWRLHGRGRRLAGRRYVNVPAPLGSAVYFVRCGRRI